VHPSTTPPADLLAATTGGLRGLLTVLGTLVFVALCFGMVELVDRRQMARRSSGSQAAGSSFAPSEPAPDTFAGAWPWHFGRVERDVATRRQTARAASVGAVAAVAVASILVPLRSAVGPASVALALVLVVVGAAAAGGRIAAAATSAVAALAFNFGHAEPLYSFHLRNTADVVTSVVMVLVGVAVGEVAVRRFRTAWQGSSVPSRRT
jgi:hypothetical protein